MVCHAQGISPADVQDDRLECDIWAWAEGYSSWLVDHIVIAGSPRERAPWDALADLLARDWPRANGGAIRIAKACVDTFCITLALLGLNRRPDSIHSC